MFREQQRYGRDPLVVLRTTQATFNAPLRWQRGIGVGGRRLVFTCSWSDWFHPDADAWRDEAWEVIKACPSLTFQILTKRPELIRDRLPRDWGPTGYQNVWLGVSVENRMFTWRVAALLEAAAIVHFVSAEPLLGPVDLQPFLAPGQVEWVIVGGESGGRPPRHPPRAMDPSWARELRDQCLTTGTAFFFKQWGGARPGGLALLDGVEWRQLPHAGQAWGEQQTSRVIATA